jgi:cobalt/nickel transport protein
MKKGLAVSAVLAVFLAAGPVFAHFGMIIPSPAFVSKGGPKSLELTVFFCHPFEQEGLEMAKPKGFGVVAAGTHEDLLGRLTRREVLGKTGWSAQVPIKKPGVYIFYVEPEPYWEPAEDSFIAHYTKVVVPAYGLEEGWDQEVGLKTEIVPLTRPFGLYAGNVFQGIVKVDGKPSPHAEVEIEFYNPGRKMSAPSEYMVTQVVKADGNGGFTYAAPGAGWWGFAALNTADFTLKKDGKDKPVEIGAVIWVYFSEWGMTKK